MKIDFSGVLKGLRGDPLKDQDGNDLTLRTIAANAILGPALPGEKLTGQIQLLRFQLAHQIFSAIEPLDIKAENVVLIKNQISANYPTIIAGQAWEIIEKSE
jgi:hypothetical protein